MNFKITRTSDYRSKPIKEAKAVEAIAIPQKIGNKSYAHNQNIWIININNFKQLMDLVEKYGKIIINPIKTHKDYQYEIEIYDDWRE